MSGEIPEATTPAQRAEMLRQNAAYDLLEALEGMVDLAEYWFLRAGLNGGSEQEYKAWHALSYGSERYRNARAAIAKAKGEKP